MTTQAAEHISYCSCHPPMFDNGLDAIIGLIQASHTLQDVGHTGRTHYIIRPCFRRLLVDFKCTLQVAFSTQDPGKTRNYLWFITYPQRLVVNLFRLRQCPDECEFIPAVPAVTNYGLGVVGLLLFLGGAVLLRRRARCPA